MSQGLMAPGDMFVGTLFRLDPKTERCIDHLAIYSSEEIFVGRDGNQCDYQVNDPYVSNKHVRIYTVVYDEDNADDVAPLVYAQDISSNGTRWNDYPMKGECFLLRDGDVLQIVPEFQLKFESAPYNKYNKYNKNSFTPPQVQEMKLFKNSYNVTQRLLGSGAYGRVHMAYQTATGQQLACKIVDLKNVKEMHAAEMEESQQPKVHTSAAGMFFTYKPQTLAEKLAPYYRESQLLAKMSHPNIISFETAIRTPDTIYIFSELVTAGDLLSYLRYKGGMLNASEAAFITRQILLALEYLHNKDIVHRDIKPDNILMTSLEAGGRVVLTDFGCAREVTQPTKRMQTVVGTYEYVAPEVNPSNVSGYNKSVDLYSLGRVTALLLTGNTPTHQPFGSEPQPMDEQKCLELELVELGITGDPKNFLQKLLTLDPRKRMNVKQALCHSWFTYLPNKDKFEELYQKSVQQWQPRPRSEPAIVEFEFLLGFQNSLRQEYSFHTQSGRRLKSYKLFETVNPSPKLSDRNTLAHGTGSIPQTTVSDVHPWRQQENVHPEQGRHGAHQAPVYPRVNPNQMIQITPNIAPTAPDLYKNQQQFVAQFNGVEQVRPSLASGFQPPHEVLSPSDIHRRGGIYTSFPGQLNEIQRYPSNSTAFFNMGAGLAPRLPSTGTTGFTRPGERFTRGPSPPEPWIHQRAADIRAAEKRDAEGLFKAEEQTYEELYNPLTGKRKRLIYGRYEDDSM